MSETNNIKYGVFMGSFDPVHKGHEKLVRDVLYWKHDGINKVIIVPAHQNPSKPQSTPYNMRVEMLNLAFKDLIKSGKVIIDTIEQELYFETNQFAIPSYLTLAHLGKKYGEFDVITTIETMVEMDGWINPGFFKDLRYVVYTFNDSGACGMSMRELNDKYPNISDFVIRGYENLHSSMIRKGSNMFRKANLAKPVYEYIHSRGLYLIDRNWSYLIEEDEHRGVTLWSGRFCAVCGIVVNRIDDKLYVLANKRGDGCPDYNGYWNMPCGFLEIFENGQEGVAREIKEECGISITPEKFKFVTVETEPGRCNNGNVTLRYIAIGEEFMDLTVTALSGEINEVSDVRWIPLNDIHKYKWAFNHYEILKNISTVLGKHYRKTKKGRQTWAYLRRMNRYLLK